MKKSIPISAGLLVAALVGLATAHATSLDVSTSATLGGKSAADATVTAQLQLKAQDRAAQEVDRRIAALNKLDARVDTMKRVSADEKSSLHTTVAGQISALTTVKAKISTDTDAATLKADLESITKSYRIFMLVIPQGAIMATADRINTTADLMTDFGAKIQTRITTAASAGHDVGAAQAAYADYTAKIADAQTQSSAALNLTENLKVDNGDQSVIDSNKKVLVEAHTKIKTGESDLKAARADAAATIKTLKGFNASASANAHVNVDTTTR